MLGEETPKQPPAHTTPASANTDPPTPALSLQRELLCSQMNRNRSGVTTFCTPPASPAQPPETEGPQGSPEFTQKWL